MDEKGNRNRQSGIATESKADDLIKTELKADDWLCIVCNKKITSDKNRFELNNMSEFQFINPAG